MTTEATERILAGIAHAGKISCNLYQDNCSDFLRTVAAAVSADTPVKVMLAGRQADDQVNYYTPLGATVV
jgi:hypothetical protein